MADGKANPLGGAGEGLLTTRIRQKNNVTQDVIDMMKKRKKRTQTLYTGPQGITDTTLLDVPVLGGGVGDTLLGQ